MADLLITNMDRRVLHYLELRAQAEGIPVAEVAGGILARATPSADLLALIEEIDAMRRAQPAQDVDAVADLRALRDGEPEQSAHRAA